MSTASDTDPIFQELISLDPKLLDDAFRFRPSNIVQLTHRLEAAVNVLSKTPAGLDPGNSKVQDYVRQLVGCYISASPTAKVARGLEKLLIATGARCQELVRVILGEEIKEVLELPTTKDLQKVSSMLEQSCMVQVVMSKFVHILIWRLCKLYLEQSSKTPEDKISMEEFDKLYIMVKLSLQIFQVFPENKEACWSPESEEESHTHPLTQEHSHTMEEGMPVNIHLCLGQIVSGIFTILTDKKWPTEITLLTGAVAAVVINTAPTPGRAVRCFFSAYDSIRKGCLSLTVGKFRLGDLSKSAEPSSQQSENRTSEIALLRAIISSTNESVAAYHVSTGTAQASSQTQGRVYSPFLVRLFPLVCELCDLGTNYHFLAFHLLSLWYKRLALSLPVLKEEQQFSLMGRGSKVLSETLRRIWITWDSPVDGVVESVVDTFKALLEIWKAEVAAKENSYTELAEELMAKVQQMPWHNRSRYKPFALLVPYIDSDQLLEDHGNVQNELLQCMGTSFLAAMAADVYTAFLQSIRKCYTDDHKALKKWQKTWMPCLLAGLTNSDSLVRQKVCSHWLPVTVKIVPDSGTCLEKILMDHLRDTPSGPQHQMLLLAMATAYKHVRNLLGWNIDDLPEDVLVEAIYSDDEDICAQAVSLLCTTQKKAEPLRDVEIQLLQSTLPFCLKVDSATFRQQLITSLRRLFVRIRDSCLSAIRKKSGAPFLDKSLEFMDWLYKFAMTNLFPGSCFQRRRTCLDIIQAWLETVVYVQSDGSKKGKAQAPMDELLTYARTRGQLDLFSLSNRTSLLHCITDGADEIQESAVHILEKYFPWLLDKPETSTSFLGKSTSCYSDGHSEIAVHLLQHGLQLCDSPRTHENNGGALLVRLVYDKYVRAQGWQFEVMRETPTSYLSVKMVAVDQGSACAAFFSKILLKLISASFNTAQANPLQAAKHQPIHGLAQALCKCINLEQESLGSFSTKAWMSVLCSAITLSTSVISLMLTLLAGGKAGSCPSFAEMGMALDEILAAEGTAEQEVTSTLSPEFQLLLSWCWLNLKESCTCLGELVAAGTKPGIDPSRRMPLETIKGIGDTFLKVLTHCRHRGAIEGCRQGFLQFCKTLMASEDATLSSIPANILSQLLASLENDEMTSSVTRRSAGLPIVIQTVMQAERKHKKSGLLLESVRRLCAIAACPTSGQKKQTQDQACVHALNVLKVIFSDASLSSELLTHLGNAMQLVIQSFESPSWAIRNAATQFVSTLVTRMFGQRNKAALTCNTVTLQEFSALYPELLDFLSQRLVKSVTSLNEATEIQPSLFLILTIISSLVPSVDSENSHRLESELHALSLMLMTSPVYYLRELSAGCVVALTPLDATQSCLMELFGQLEVDEPKFSHNNYIHGILLCLDKLLSSRPKSAVVAKEITEFILENNWLVLSSRLCPFVTAKCVDMLQQVAPTLPEESPLREKLIEMLVSLLFCPSFQELQVGQAVLKTSAISLAVSLLQSTTKKLSVSLQEFSARCIHSDDVDIRTAILHYYSQTVSSWVDNTSVINCLWSCLKEETDPTCLVMMARILVTLNMEDSTESKVCRDPTNDPPPCNDLDPVRLKFHQLYSIQAALFPLEALILLGQLKTTGSSPAALHSSLSEWSTRLQSHSLPHSNEDFRLAAAQALVLTGQPFLQYYRRTQDAFFEAIVIRILESCLILLDETDREVRKLTTRFIGSLQWEKKHPAITKINSNFCSKVLLSYLLDELWWSRAVWDSLLHKLYQPGELSACIQKYMHDRSHVLFEHEESTFLSEKILRLQEIFDILMVMSHSFMGNAGYIASSLSVLVSELGLCITLFEESAANCPVYNLSGDSHVMASLVGLAFQAHILNECFSKVASEGQIGSDVPLHLSEELNRLFRIKNLHPAYSSFLSWV